MSIKIIHDLRKARGSNAKLRILDRNFHDMAWRSYLVATYDTATNYYVSAPSDETFVDEANLSDVVDAGLALSTRSFTGHAARRYALECSQAYGELFRLMLKGNIRAGVSTATINKAYPGLIKEYPLMLAKDAPIKEYPCYMSTKYDGVRVLAHVTYDSASEVTRSRLLTRAGKELQIDSLLRSMARCPPGVYDGELVSGRGLQAGRTSITGSVNRVLKGTATDIDDYTYCVFDHIAIGAWYEQYEPRPYSVRLASVMGLKQPGVISAQQEIAYNENEVNAFYNDRIAKGYEGIIVRYFNDRYIWRRTDRLVKKKATEECILECVSIKGGTGKYEGMLGALYCEGIVKGKSIKVNVGSGFSDYERGLPSSTYIGEHIEVLYNDIVHAEGVGHFSLFLPRYKRIVGEI